MSSALPAPSTRGCVHPCSSLCAGPEIKAVCGHILTNFDIFATLPHMSAVGKTTRQTDQTASARGERAEVSEHEAACCPPTAPNVASAATIPTPLARPAPANRSQIAGLAEGSGTEALAERLKALA